MSQHKNRSSTTIYSLKTCLLGLNAAVEFQQGSTSLQWYDSSSLLFSTPVPRLSHCLYLSIVYIPPSGPSSLLSSQFISWLCLVGRKEPDCRTFPELIGVTLACPETDRHYENTQSITGQWINIPSLIFDFHIAVRANGCDAQLLSAQGHLVSISRRSSEICPRSLVVIVGLPWIWSPHCKLKISM